MNRDAFYKYRKRSVRRKTVEEKVVALVQNKRREQPWIGSRKLHFTLQKQFISQVIKVVRDRLIDILRENKMLIRRKRAYTKTTNSFRRFYKYKYLIKDLEITRPNQVCVADITFIRTQIGFCFLSLITDFYSKRNVGYHLNNVIHNSERGIQYCSNQYVEELKKRGFLISMTEEKHCYENVVAERINDILKDEFFLDQVFFNMEHAKTASKNAIEIYNDKRIHLSLQFKTQNYVYYNN